MPIEKRRLEGLLTLTEMARLTGLTQSTFWRLVHEDGLLPPPTTTCGRRTFYTEAELPAVKKAAAALIEKGRGDERAI